MYSAVRSDCRLRLFGSQSGLTGGDEAPMAFRVFPPRSSSGRLRATPEETLAGIPNELSTEEVPYELLLGIHRSTILPDTPDQPAHMPAANAAIADGQQPMPEVFRDPARDSSLGVITRRRRSALDFDARTPPMERGEMEQLLDFATRDWRADCDGSGRRAPQTQARLLANSLSASRRGLNRRPSGAEMNSHIEKSAGMHRCR